MRTMNDRKSSEAQEFTAAGQLGHSLDPIDWKSFREQAHLMLDDMLEHMQTLRQRPVWQVIPDEVRGRFKGGLPARGEGLAEVHEEFMRSVVPYSVGNAHPGFMGWVQGGGTPVGMLAEMLAAGLNANVGGRDQIPLEVERQVVGWMRELFGFPEGASGLFVAGTSIANLVAVVVARHAAMDGKDRRRGVQGDAVKLTAYASSAVHGSLGRAFEMAGLGSASLRKVKVDARQRIDLRDLTAQIAEDRAAGFTPFFVAGTAGTVDTGAIDDLAGVGAVCEREGLWFHVDGAYGALAMLAPEMRKRLRGIEKADSLAFDFHKWAQVPYDSGMVLFRDGERHRAAFESPCSYLIREERGMSAGSPWPCDLGPELSRGFRALKVWATFKTYGTDALAAVVRESCGLARYLEELVAESPELELMAPVELNIVCFRYRFAANDEEANALARQIVIELQEGGKVAPSTTMIDGRVAIRAAIVNHRTTSVEMRMLVNEVLAAGRALSPVPVLRMEEEDAWRPWADPGIEREAWMMEIDASQALANIVFGEDQSARLFDRRIN